MPNLEKYQNYLSVPVFVQHAYDDINETSHKEYFLRGEKGSKELLEEILPLATFLRHFETPSNLLHCKYFLRNSPNDKTNNYDAKIKLSGEHIDKGYIPSELFLEVTVAEREHQGALMREKLAKDGFSSFDNYREKGSRKIVSEYKAYDTGSYVGDAAELIKGVLKKKYNKNEPYPSPCILIVQIEPQIPLTLNQWIEVVNDVRDVVQKDKFFATYIVSWQTNSAFQILKT